MDPVSGKVDGQGCLPVTAERIPTEALTTIRELSGYHVTHLTIILQLVRQIGRQPKNRQMSLKLKNSLN